MASVEYTHSYRLAFIEIREFLLKQDVESAPSRFAVIRAEVDSIIKLVRQYPRMGRPFKPVLITDDEEAQQDLIWINKRIENTGLTEVRELILRDFSVLYVNSDIRVVLLSIKHHRSVKYRPAEL